MSRELDSELVRELARLLEETGLGEIEYAAGDWRVRVARPAAPAPAPAAPAAAPPPAAAPGPAAAPPAARTAADGPEALKSPMVGTAYLGPDPDSPPFVAIGARVAEGETVMIVEAMKVMNTIPAHRSGTVRDIAVASGQPVEFGQVLMVIE